MILEKAKSKACLAALCCLLPKICPTLENPSQSQRGWARSWTPHVVQGLPRAPKGSDWVTNPYINTGRTGKKVGKPHPNPAVMRVLLAQGWSQVGTGDTSDTSDFPASRGDPSLHPYPWAERGPEWLEQDRQGQEGSQKLQSHVDASPGNGMQPQVWQCRQGSLVVHGTQLPEHSHFALPFLGSLLWLQDRWQLLH